MAAILKQYKLKNGEVNFPVIFTVPSSERLPSLYSKDFMQATALVVGVIALAFEKINLKKKDGVGVLINNIAEEVLDTCDEDNLSLEDLVLFLQGLVRGRYGSVEDMSVARFMTLFDKYRDERHFAIVEYRENQHLEYKSLGDAERTVKSDPLADHFASIGDRINELKESLRYERNPKLKDIDKF